MTEGRGNGREWMENRLVCVELFYGNVVENVGNECNEGYECVLLRTRGNRGIWEGV